MAEAQLIAALKSARRVLDEELREQGSGLLPGGYAMVHGKTLDQIMDAIMPPDRPFVRRFHRVIKKIDAALQSAKGA